MSAVISECGNYRTRLERVVQSHPLVAIPRMILWVMLNPSTADAHKNDQTIRKVLAFSLRWGFHRLMVGNLFAYRSTDPYKLGKLASTGFDIVGPGNDEELVAMAKKAELVVCAWGAHGETWPERAEAVGKLLVAANPNVKALKFTISGHPYHPLYLPLETELLSWAS